MEPIAAAVEDPSLVFDFPSPKELRPPLIVLDDASVGYVAGVPVLSRLNLRIDPDDGLALVGRNGNGKTTLARLLAGQLKPMGRSLVASGKLRVGYFAQHQIEELVADGTPLQHMERLLPGAKPGEIRAQLGRFGFSGDKANLKVRQLSGGERARLSLALITRDAPHILILDEPTNHLDVDAREALVQALTDFGGAVLVVSHDRHLLGLIADRLLLVDDGTARELEGSLDDYRNMVLGAGRGAAEDVRSGKRVSRETELMKARAEVECNIATAEHRWLEASEAAERASVDMATRGGQTSADAEQHSEGRERSPLKRGRAARSSRLLQIRANPAISCLISVRSRAFPRHVPN